MNSNAIDLTTTQQHTCADAYFHSQNLLPLNTLFATYHIVAILIIFDTKKVEIRPFCTHISSIILLRLDARLSILIKPTDLEK